MMLKNSVKQRFTLLMVLKLTDEDERDYVLSRVTIHGPKPNLSSLVPSYRPADIGTAGSENGSSEKEVFGYRHQGGWAKQAFP
jgi:hypothetical protein